MANEEGLALRKGGLLPAYVIYRICSRRSRPVPPKLLFFQQPESSDTMYILHKRVGCACCAPDWPILSPFYSNMTLLDQQVFCESFCFNESPAAFM